MKKIGQVFKKFIFYLGIFFTLLICLCTLFIIFFDDPTYSTIQRDPIEESDGDPRNQLRTYTTFPEWYIVYSAEEYASFLENGNSPSNFPFFAATAQYKEIEKMIIGHVGGPDKIDDTTKTVLSTISSSFALENSSKGLYENTFGRLSLLLNLGIVPNEDEVVTKSANSYATFLLHTPWYSFPYQKTLFSLWQSYGLSSLSPRGLERRISFSLGYILKGTFGRIIHHISQNSYGGASQNTYIELENVSDSTIEQIGNVSLYINPNSSSTQTIVLLPRYRAFKEPFLALLRSQATIVNIQGHEQIMFSVVAKRDTPCEYLMTNQLTSFPILTQAQNVRYLLDVNVSELATAVEALTDCQIEIEHFYDY